MRDEEAVRLGREIAAGQVLLGSTEPPLRRSR